MLRVGDAGHEPLRRRVRPGPPYVGERAVFTGLDTADNLASAASGPTRRSSSSLKSASDSRPAPACCRARSAGAASRGSPVIGGEGWVRAAEAQDLEIATVVIGPGQEYEDPYGDSPRLNEVSDPGALLVLPDGHVAFRYAAAGEDAEELLSGVLRRILGHA